MWATEVSAEQVIIKETFSLADYKCVYVSFVPFPLSRVILAAHILKSLHIIVIINVCGVSEQTN